MEIRTLDGPEDVRGAIRVNGRAWRAAYDDILPRDVLERISVDPADDDVRERYEQVRETTGAFLLAVDDVDTVRGYASFRWGDDTKDFVGPDEAGLKEIYVDPDDWGRGIGTRLLEHGIDRLPAGVERLLLEAFADNDVGRAFYEARGFSAVDEGRVELADERYATTIFAKEL